ncbi:unnamed protein product [Amoebophrya sp. A25]|nr:unnamed protein product [Amoebophrya sp. A25]|eukprot:GSA25T00013459001.1
MPFVPLPSLGLVLLTLRSLIYWIAEEDGDDHDGDGVDVDAQHRHNYSSPKNNREDDNGLVTQADVLPPADPTQNHQQAHHVEASSITYEKTRQEDAHEPEKEQQVKTRLFYATTSSVGRPQSPSVTTASEKANTKPSNSTNATTSSSKRDDFPLFDIAAYLFSGGTLIYIDAVFEFGDYMGWWDAAEIRGPSRPLERSKVRAVIDRWLRSSRERAKVASNFIYNSSTPLRINNVKDAADEKQPGPDPDGVHSNIIQNITSVSQRTEKRTTNDSDTAATFEKRFDAGGGLGEGCSKSKDMWNYTSLFIVTGDVDVNGGASSLFGMLIRVAEHLFGGRLGAYHMAAWLLEIIDPDREKWGPFEINQLLYDGIEYLFFLPGEREMKMKKSEAQQHAGMDNSVNQATSARHQEVDVEVDETGKLAEDSLLSILDGGGAGHTRQPSVLEEARRFDASEYDHHRRNRRRRERYRAILLLFHYLFVMWISAILGLFCLTLIVSKHHRMLFFLSF